MLVFFGGIKIIVIWLIKTHNVGYGAFLVDFCGACWREEIEGLGCFVEAGNGGKSDFL